MKTLSRILLIAALMVSIGLHWGVLQVVAWTQMIQDYSAEKGLVIGLKETFDGEHPCERCHKIVEGQNSEHKQSSLPLEKLIQAPKWVSEFALNVLPDPVWSSIIDVSDLSNGETFSDQWQSAPPTPPPREI